MRIPFIAGNWKMFKTVHETTVYVKELRGLVKDVIDVTVVVAPPFTAVHAAAEAARNSNVAVSAQNMFWEKEGAFTGETSAGMIKEAGAEYVIIGHSERRTLFGETDVTVNRRVMAAIAADLTPIVCIGETLDQRERNEGDGRAGSADQGASTASPAMVGASSWPTSPSGRSERGRRRRRSRPAKRTRTSGHACGSGSAPRPRTNAWCCMAAASNPTISAI
jgi:triosephosphate isomerase